MSENFFSNPGEFVGVFDFRDSGYDPPVNLTDRKIGFSTLREYPDNIKFVPAKTKDGAHDTVAILHIVYTHPDESKVNIEPDRVPVFIKVGKFSRYRINHFDYDFTDEDCPSEESLLAMKKSQHPVDLESDEYYFNHDENLFFDNEGNKLSGIELLDSLYQKHCHTVHWLKGIRIQWKLRSQKIFINIFSLFIRSLVWVLAKVFGRTLDSERDAFYYLSGYKRQDMKKLSTESLKLLGYKASKGVILLFSIVVLLFIFLRFIDKEAYKFLKDVFSVNLYSAAFVIVALWIFDDVVPRWLFWLVNRLIKTRTKIHLLKFKL